MHRSKITRPGIPLQTFLFALGICLAAISVMHILIAACAVLVNAANIYLRRRPMPVILLIISMLAALPALVGTFYFDSGFPWALCLGALAVSAAAALLSAWFGKKRNKA